MANFYTLERTEAFIRSALENPKSPNVVCCFNRNKKMIHTFIRISEPSSFEIPWRGGITNLEKGDYLHASLTDIYGIKAEDFHRTYQIIIK